MQPPLLYKIVGWQDKCNLVGHLISMGASPCSLALTNEKHADGRLLVCRIRRIEKEEPCVNVGDTLGKDILYTLAVTPPMLRIVILIWNRNYADGDIITKSFLEEETSATRVNILRYTVATAHSQIVVAKQGPQRNRRTVCSVAVHDS